MIEHILTPEQFRKLNVLVDNKHQRTNTSLGEFTLFISNTFKGTYQLTDLHVETGNLHGSIVFDNKKDYNWFLLCV